MDSVVLLSEIHPLVPAHNPLKQATQWFGLFTDSEIQSFSRGTISFIEAIEAIRQRVVERNDNLVIRDWSHLDFTGVPFLNDPSCKLTLSAELSRHYNVISAFTVRHPVDQWISLNNLTMLSNDDRPDAASFIHGYHRFSQFAHKTGFVRYEDFCRDSNGAMQSLCETLKLPFDGSYNSKWKHYHTITGDNTTPSRTKRGKPTSIETLPRQSLNDKALEELACYDEYHKSLALLGYA